jgi:hypothetical protein
VEAAAETEAAELDDAEAAAFHAVLGGELFEADDAVGEGLELEVAGGGGAVVEEEDGAMPADEELLEGEDLASVAEGISGEEAHFGEGVEDDAGGLVFFNDVEDGLGGFGELDFGRAEEGILLFTGESFFGARKFVKDEAVEVPVVGAGDGAEFFIGFREGDVESFFAFPGAVEEELEGEGGFAGAWVSLDEVEAVLGESSVEDIVQSLDAGRDEGGVGGGRCHGHSLQKPGQ